MSSRSARFLSAELAGRGTEAWIDHRGGSMSPCLRNGDRLRVVSLAGEVPLPGEVIVAARGDLLVTHRLVSIEGGLAVTRGDACANDDPPIDARALIGRVVEVERSGRSFAPDAKRRDGAREALRRWVGRCLAAGLRAYRRAFASGTHQ